MWFFLRLGLRPRCGAARSHPPGRSLELLLGGALDDELGHGGDRGVVEDQGDLHTHP